MEEIDWENMIMEYLKNHKDEQFSILELSEKLHSSWITISKFVEVLFAKSKIIMEDRGNLKLVKYKGA
jgi:response regulator of citrate/malate metabolism